MVTKNAGTDTNVVNIIQKYKQQIGLFVKLLAICLRTHLGVLAALMAFFCAVSSHAQIAPGPLAGTWGWTLFSGGCAETLQYRADGILISTSGDAVTEWSYAVTSTPDSQDFYESIEVTTRFNAEKDCSGDVVNELGLDATKYIQFNPARNQMIVCKSASLQACYGPLLRTP